MRLGGTVTGSVTKRRFFKRFTDHVAGRLGISGDVERHRGLDARVPHHLLKDGRHHSGSPARTERASQVMSRRRLRHAGLRVRPYLHAGFFPNRTDGTNGDEARRTTAEIIQREEDEAGPLLVGHRCQ
ncbi:MAG: hypothetical protein QM775_09460 [Pirellulales bacterium]